MFLRLLAILLALWALPAVSSRAQTPLPNPIPHFSAIKVVLIGDSTMQVQSGWGGAFCAKHLNSLAACVNLARGGRSSGSYRVEGSWDLALKEISSGGFDATYVLIQFGHNDQPGKPGRTTDLASEFPANLAAYVEETRALGAIPVLVTPLTRRQFRDGRLEDSLGPWAQAVRKVAADKGVGLVDLYALSSAGVQAMGAVAATGLAQKPPSPAVLAAAGQGTTIAEPVAGAATPPSSPAQVNATVEPLGQPRTAFDYTHLGDAGAAYFSAMVAKALADAEPGLRRYLFP